MTRGRWPLFVVAVASALAWLHTSACEICDAPDVLETGTYRVSEVDEEEVRFGHASEWAWMEGASVHVDREEGFMTIRYTRDATTYEMRYELIDQ